MTLKSYVDVLKLALLVVAVAIVPVLIWYLFGVVLMAFGAIILAMLLHLGAQPFMRWLKLPQAAALILSGVVILIILGGAGYMFGTRIVDEFQDVVQRATAASGVIRSNLQESEFGNFLLHHISGGDLSLAGMLPGFLRVSTSFLEAVIVMAISGIYLAAQPRIYRDGIVWLFPPRKHARVAEIIDGIGEGLRLWLLGQLIQMVLIGIMVTLAVWIIGVPSPLALGLIAGIAEFIPYLGPILAAIPAILVALTKSPELALWTFIVYIIIHQIEGQIIAPMVQHRLVSIPPAVLLLGIAALTYLFGAIAIIFAAPIAVVIFTAINLIYVRDTLGENTELIQKLR
ncbi:MAG: AI-2E family transporter [Hyphomicrobiales bacterium]|nr:AI-2E family transporter [Hyphomicrobiales bacterium]